MTPKPTLLYIEDEPIAMTWWKENLSVVYDVKWCETIAQALQYKHLSNFPDAILLDLCLPDASDLDCIVKVRAAFPTAPIVVLTSREFDEIDVLRAGAQDYFKKDCASITDVEERLRNAIVRRQVEQDFRRVDEKVVAIQDAVLQRISDSQALKVQK